MIFWFSSREITPCFHRNIFFWMYILTPWSQISAKIHRRLLWQHSTKGKPLCWDMRIDVNFAAESPVMMMVSVCCSVTFRLGPQLQQSSAQNLNLKISVRKFWKIHYLTTCSAMDSCSQIPKHIFRILDTRMKSVIRRFVVRLKIHRALSLYLSI